jgi:hypothetical protein
MDSSLYAYVFQPGQKEEIQRGGSPGISLP